MSVRHSFATLYWHLLSLQFYFCAFLTLLLIGYYSKMNES
ncbi:hypothetical protein PSPO_b1024 [Pseudoalteromonas spongiae UST010723-006]|nr:hypothetical protein PSPO_b1024 [Pseudoalteromonas spongiae UST010723-006]